MAHDTGHMTRDPALTVWDRQYLEYILTKNYL